MIPQELEPNIVSAKLKTLLESIELPRDFPKTLASALEPLTEKQEKLYKETVGYVNSYQEETAKILDEGTAKLANNQDHLKEELYTNTKHLQQTGSKANLSEILNTTSPTVSSNQ
jgi:hypothetical protein